MPTISLTLIAKNEEKHIKQCFDSIYPFVDKIILVDTGSTDNTIEIAKTYDKCEVHSFKWRDDFSKARNYALSFVDTDYWMWLDLDDIIKKEDLDKLLALKPTLNKYDIVSLVYNYGFTNQDYMNGNPTLAFRRNRIFKTSLRLRWMDPIHEFVETLSYPALELDAAVTHTRTHSNGTRNLDIFRSMIKNNKKMTPRNKYYYAKELYYNGLYSEALPELLGVIERKENWFEEILQAAIAVCEIYKFKRNYKKVRETCFNTFNFVSIPRAEFTYRIADSYFIENDIKSAIYWYEIAANTEIPKNAGYINEEYYNFLPNLQLAVCYYKIGKIEKSIEHNDLAAKVNPNHSSVIYNKKFFDKIVANKKM